jgi:ligand-binding sensor domain-containing protein
MICTYCGAENPEDAKFCKECGKTINNPSGDQAKQNDKLVLSPSSRVKAKAKSKRSKWKGIFVVIALTVGLLILDLMVVYKGKLPFSHPAKTSAPVASVSAEQVNQAVETSPPGIMEAIPETSQTHEAITRDSWVDSDSLDFSRLPNPVRVLDSPEGVWEVFSNCDSATALLEQGGVLWAATSGGIVAWDIGSGNYKHYTVYDGLSTNEISSLVLTQQNEIWAGSWESGISRFNGSKWEVIYSPGLSEIETITNDGSIWASDRYGEARLGQYISGDWKIYTKGNGLPDDAKYLNDVVADPNGGLWVKTDNSLMTSKISYFNDGIWNTYTDGLPTYFNILGVSSDSKLWLLDSKSNIGTYDGGIYTKLVTLPGAYQGYPRASIVTDDNTLIFSTYNQVNIEGSGLIILKGTQLNYLSVADGLPSNNMLSLHVGSGGLWIGTSKGIAISNDGLSWKIYKTGEGIASNAVEGIQVDDEGSVWFATTGGVSRFDGKKWYSYTEVDGLADDLLWSIAYGPQKTLWFGTWTSGLVSSYDGFEWHSYGISDGLNAGDYVWSLAVAPNGAVWAGTNNGVAVFDGFKWQTFVVNDDQSLKNVRSVAVSKNGDVWIGTYEGKVAHLSGSNWTVFDKESGLAGGYVMAIGINDQGDVFAGTYDGLFKFSNDKWEFIPNSPGYINDIAFTEDGSIWIATEFDGIQRYDGTAWKENYRLGNGLPGLRMQTIAIAPDHTIWVGGSGGAVKFTPRSN